MAAFIGQNVLDGTPRPWSAYDVDQYLGRLRACSTCTRGRSTKDHLPGAVNVPHTELRAIDG